MNIERKSKTFIIMSGNFSARSSMLVPPFRQAIMSCNKKCNIKQLHSLRSTKNLNVITEILYMIKITNKVENFWVRFSGPNTFPINIQLMRKLKLNKLFPRLEYYSRKLKSSEDIKNYESRWLLQLPIRCFHKVVLMPR